MVFFLQILANYAGLIYLACVVGMVLYLREIFAARLDRKQSLYSLEREAANARASRGVLMIFVLGLVAGATFVMSTYVTPTLATAQPETTPTPPFTLTTETPTPTLQPSPTRTPRPTLTPTGQAPAPIEATPPAAESLTPTLTPPPLPPASCPDPNVQLVAPAPGQTFNGSIQLRGTADAPNFAFYKFTLKGPATNDVALTVGEVVREPRRDAVLGDIDGASLLASPGTYIISLIVVDNTGNESPACSVPVIIQP
jgi:hypothetical protein